MKTVDAFKILFSDRLKMPKICVLCQFAKVSKIFLGSLKNLRKGLEFQSWESLVTVVKVATSCS